MQIDWTILSYAVIGLFAFIGFFRGWWKEALTTFFLTLLVLLLRRPDLAQTIIDWLNEGIAAASRLVVRLFGFPESTTTVFQLDPSRSSTWIIILLAVLGLSVLLAWFFLPGTTSKLPAKYYTLTVIGRLLGLAVGAVNGFLFINLVREYLDGRSLPGNAPATDVAATSAGGAAVAAPAPTFAIQVVNLPDFTILDSYVPWLIVGSGLLVLFILIWSRIVVRTKTGAGSRLDFVPPYGYAELKAEKPKRTEVQPVVIQQ